MMNRLRLVVALLGLAAAPLGAQASTVVFARHGEKGPGSPDPDLSDAGRVRAADLATALALFHVDAVFVTEYKRTRQTGDSTATFHHLVPTVIATQGDPKLYAAAIAAAIRKLPAGSVALVVGHSNTAAAAIAALGGPKIADLCDAEYATLLVLELPGDPRPPRLLRSTFGAADKLEAATCPRMRMQ